MKKYTYPACKTVDVVEDWFGVQLPDPYAWLKEAKSKEVLDFVAAENAYTDDYFDRTALDHKIAQLKAAALPPLPSSISPFRDGYVGTFHRDGRYVNEIMDDKLHTVAPFPPLNGYEDYDLFQVQPDPVDNRYVACMIQKPGAPRPTILVYDMEKKTGLYKAEMCFSYCWSKKNGCLYASSTESDSAAQTCRTRFLSYNPVSGEEKVVYSDDSNCIFGQVYPSRDGAYVAAQVCQDYSLGNWIAINTATGESFTLTKEPVEWYYADSIGDTHYFVTVTGAPNGKVIAVTSDGNVLTALPESGKVILNSAFSQDGKLYAIGKKDVSACLIEVASGKEVPLPGRFAALSEAGEGRKGVLLQYESFLDAPRILEFSKGSFRTLLTSSEDKWDDLTAEQHFTPSKDGTLIPYYIVYRKDLVRDGSAPAVMYAYGGYNMMSAPWYTEMVTGLNIPKWVQGGGVYVHLNIRGGNEYGPRWHEDGMMMTKRHCYEDFIAIAERVIADGFTSKGKIGITGCSNGGLLMSALVTMRPDLWGCVIDSVPHTDMIHFAEDDRGPMYITEYGNPRGSEEMFRYLLSYSPYHNVKAVDYPPTYVQTGEMDNNVPPYHGKKFAARMQAMNTSDHPILLRVLAEGSHDRGKGEVYWKTIAEMQLFLEQHLKG